MLTDGLYRRKDFRAARASSFDRSGRNDDSLAVPAGQTVRFAQLEGPGVVKHIWMTTQAPALDRLVLRITWDGAPGPSVEVPLGSFFGLGFGRPVPLVSAAVAVSPSGGMNCYFPMPFRTSATFEIENQADEDSGLYFHIDYEQGREVGEDACYFHTQWRAEISEPSRGPDPTPENYDAHGNFHDILANTDGQGNYRILTAEGQGHYVGCFMHTFSFLPTIGNVRCWYGEGDDMIFVDGEPWPPAIHGTGEEDYFNDAWGLHAFQSPYFGCHYIDALSDTAGRYSAYRFHIPDPIPFRTEIAATIEHGHGNERGDYRQSLAFYYLTAPTPGEPLPPYADRHLMTDYRIVPRQTPIPRRTGPYDPTFPDGQERRNC